MALDKPNRLTASATRMNSGVSCDAGVIICINYKADTSAIGQAGYIPPNSLPLPGRIPFVYKVLRRIKFFSRRQPGTSKKRTVYDK